MNDRLISLPHYSRIIGCRIHRTVWQAMFGVCVACCSLLSAQAATEFHVQEIRLEGLQRISAGTVFNYLPIKNGDLFDSKASKKAIEALFKTGLFNDIRLEQEGDILIIRMLERPAISKITFNGNKELDTEELNKSLKTIGFAEGRVFDRSLLERVELELQRLYFSRGHYAARLTSTVTPQSRNRVNIQIDISEGKPATIHQINLVGNEAFGDGVLLDEFELSPSSLFSFFSSADQYSKQKLTADLENLRAFYLDRGYLNFSIDSTQVSITPNKQDIYLTINLTEGKKYTVADVKILGNLILPEADLQKKLQIKPGDVFSRKQITASTEALTEALGDEGYAFANINTLPEPKVAGGDELVLSFFVDPGQRVYVRRINFEGNSKTRDEVLRREMRQMEGGWASTAKIKRSRTRLERLRFFDEVTVETPAVPDIADQIDVNYTVVERPSGNFLAGIGYSQTQGMLFNTSVTQDNFLGSGKRVSVAFNNSQVNTVYSFNYLDPYYTIDGISQSVGLYYRQTDAEQANLSRYALDAFGGSLTYGIPISENNSVFLGLEPEHLQVKTTGNSAKEIFDYIDKYGDTFNTVKLTASWSHDTRDRAIFPESGMLQSLGAEVAVPIGDNLEYYKLNGKIAWYYPVFKNYVLMLDTEVGYGESYGNTDFPFFENYTAGGPRSVRGFRENTLGPRDSNGNPLGGGFKLVGGAEFFLPMPFVKESRSVRLSAFVDIGNVYRTQSDFDANTLRYSTGVSAIWLSPLGALSFSLAQPLNDEEGDDTQIFQFTLGGNF